MPAFRFRWPEALRKVVGSISLGDTEIRTLVAYLQGYLELVATTTRSEDYLESHPEFKRVLDKYELVRK